MSEISAAWDGTVTGDAVNAPYSSAEWARIWRDMLRASKADSGPLLGSGTSPDPGLTVQATSPASANVEVTAGSALVRGTWYANDATVTLAIGANGSGNPRIDTVVLQKNVVTQTVRLVVLQGLPAVTPVPLPLTQLDVSVWEIPLADIAVASGFATITATDIRPRRSWANAADGVYLSDVLNNSGVTLETGDVVIWDTTANWAVTTTTTVGDPKVAGVWVGRTGAGGYGRVLTHGIGYVNMTFSVANRGLRLIPWSVAKTAVAQPSAVQNSQRNAVGYSLQTTAGGLCLAFIDIGAQQPGAIAVGASTSTSTSNSLTFVDTNANHKISITPHGSRVRVTFQFSGGIADATKVGYWDIYSVGLAARAGDVNLGLTTASGGSNNEQKPITLIAIFTGLTSGVAQEFRLQHKTSDAGSNVLTNAVIMYAEEL